MMDDLFEKPNLPAKRKLQVSHDPADFYKPAKQVALESNGVKRDPAPSEEEAANVAEEEEEGDYGPQEVDGDEEDGADEEEGGRFFGSGMDKVSKDALRYVNAAEADTNAAYSDEKMDAARVKSIVTGLKKKISRNCEMRARHGDDAAKFVESEADLDAAIRDVSQLCQHTQLYSEFAGLGGMAALVSQLAHENADIAIDTIQIVSELLDEDNGADEAQWRALAAAALEADLVSLLESNFRRLDDGSSSSSAAEDQGGMYDGMVILEQLLSSEAFMQRVAERESLVGWLLLRAVQREALVSRNKQYAAELLSIFVVYPHIKANRRLLVSLDAVDQLLQVVAPYRRVSPTKNTDEEEWFENVLDTLCCLVQEPEGKVKFVEAEGVELCLIFLREARAATQERAVRLLAFAAEGGPEVCISIVQSEGLKTLGKLLMKKQRAEDGEGLAAAKSKKQNNDKGLTNNLLNILSSLVSSLPADSDERIRVIAKFVEKSFEKVERLFQLRASLPQRPPNNGHQEGEGESLNHTRTSKLYIDLIFAWLLAENDVGIRQHTLQLCKKKDHASLNDIKATLQRELGQMEEEEETENGDDVDAAAGFVSMLKALLSTF